MFSCSEDIADLLIPKFLALAELIGLFLNRNAKNAQNFQKLLVVIL